MTIQQIVAPSQIESELLKIWEGLAKQNKMRACLFNLIVFNRLSARTDYIRSIVQKVVEKFPCRTLFISSDPDSPHPYLKTAVSVVIPQSGESSIACDQIDIGVSGPDVDRVFFTLLPHIIPDLPVYLLWTEDPGEEHPLFEPLSKLATRIIFDSESADNLLSFSQKVLDLHAKTKIDIADLNWARTEGWRELVSSTFASKHRLSQLEKLNFLKITYNARETQFFCHLKIQAMYLLAWISNRLNWDFVRAGKNLGGETQLRSSQKTNSQLELGLKKQNRVELLVEFKGIEAQIASDNWTKLGPGTVISLYFETLDGMLFEAARIPELYHYVKIQTTTAETCDLPYRFVLGQTATGQSLVKEICTKGTSTHYLEMLKNLKKLDKDKLC